MAGQLKSAGSNIAFAAVAEISDSILKGAEANGFDGLVEHLHLLFFNWLLHLCGHLFSISLLGALYLPFDKFNF